LRRANVIGQSEADGAGAKPGSVGHNLPQEASQVFAQAVIDAGDF
jgi:hypothetical protein